MHWLELAENVQNKTNSVETNTDDDTNTTTTTNTNTNDTGNQQNNNNHNNENNNNTIYRRKSINSDENSLSNNIGTNEIPKIVGKLGRLESNQYFSLKQNGSICENAFREQTRSVDEAMDQ